MSDASVVHLCPGQGAQAVGMGRSWHDSSAAAASTFERAEAILSTLPNWSSGPRLRDLCFDGPADELERTDRSQPALFVCGIACLRALHESAPVPSLAAAAGLSLGEYTALVIAGAFSFEDGVRLVAERGRLMQQAAEASKGGMVALIGADEQKALQVCADAAQGEVLVCANFNAPGQIVLSGHATACDRAGAAASRLGVRASRLKVAGAFHSPLMAPAAEGLALALAPVSFSPLACDVWSNVTARRHDRNDATLIRKLLVDQLVSPVRWSQGCEDMIASLSTKGGVRFHELAPGSVLKGLMRRIDRSCEVTSHDQAQPTERAAN